MSSVWSMILHKGSTINVSIELADATRHRRDMNEKLLKAQTDKQTVAKWQAPVRLRCALNVLMPGWNLRFQYHTGQCLRRLAGGNVGLPLDTT